jgi:putative oxidoreductase
MDAQDLRRTSDDSLAGAIRMALGALFLMTGVMKLAVPLLADAFAAQLSAAGIPLIPVWMWVVPVVEIAAGLALLVGAYTRIVAIVIMTVMAVAAYVHVVVDDPAAFPLQPSEPVVPLAVIVMAAYLVWRGGGSGSADLREVPRGA